MLRTGYDRLTFVAIGIGGVFGAGLRWAISRSGEPADFDSGWFTYTPNTSVTVGANVSSFEPVRSSQTIATATGIPVDTLIVNTLGHQQTPRTEKKTIGWAADHQKTPTTPIGWAAGFQKP